MMTYLPILFHSSVTILYEIILEESVLWEEDHEYSPEPPFAAVFDEERARGCINFEHVQSLSIHIVTSAMAWRTNRKKTFLKGVGKQFVTHLLSRLEKVTINFTCFHLCGTNCNP